MRARAALLVIVLLTVSGSAVLPGGEAAVAGGPAVTLNVTIEQSGDAVWTVSARYELQDTNETAAFDTLGADYEANETTAGPQIETFRTLAAQVDDVDRDMTVSVVEKSSVIRNRSAIDDGGVAVGILRLEFRWSNFATTDGGTISVGDAFGPSWSLGENQALIITPPSGYGVDTVRPSTAVQNGVIRWDGPLTFSDEEPAVTYVPADTGTTETTPGSNGQSNSEFLILVGYVAGIAVALVGGGLAVYAWIRRDEVFGEDGDFFGGRAESSDESSDDSPSDKPSSSGSDERADDAHSDEVSRDETEAEDGQDSDKSDDQPDGTADIDPSLLSDEERVHRLLEANGGRMKQADIVEATGWSNAKVSQLLSSMAEEGEVEKLRIGRENLISLPDDDHDSGSS